MPWPVTLDTLLPSYSAPLRFADLSCIASLILALPGKADQLYLQGQQDGGQSRRQETSKAKTRACSVCVVSNQMEAGMHKTTITVSLAVLAAALLASTRAEAGASAS